MNKNALLKYLEGSRDYTFRIDDYIVPKFIENINGYPIDIQDNRNNALRQGSAWSPKFRSMLQNTYPDLRFVREFPFVIDDRKYWESLCDEFDLTDEERRRYYFIVDYLFPDYNFIVEIDSDLHKTDYDKARDNYILFSYQIPTLRLFEFGRNDNSDLYLTDEFHVELLSMKKSGCKFRPGFSMYLIKRFYRRNKNIIPVLDLIESAILDGRIRNNTFTIRRSDQLVKNRWDLLKIQDIIMGAYGVFVDYIAV